MSTTEHDEKPYLYQNYNPAVSGPVVSQPDREIYNQPTPVPAATTATSLDIVGEAEAPHAAVDHLLVTTDIHERGVQEPTLDHDGTLSGRVNTLIDEKRVEINQKVDEVSTFLQHEVNPDSHQLARDNTIVDGAVANVGPQGVQGKVRDLGWHRPTVEIPDPLIGGISNDKLFSLVRRFNKDVFDVRAVPIQVTRGLDLNEAWAPDHASDKIPLQLQRLYLTVVLGLASLFKHVSRLRSWRESKRTAAFLAVYITAWFFDFLVTLFIGMLVAMITSEKARHMLFPPAPLAIVNVSTGAFQPPRAGQLGTLNTLTGAPEKQAGEAAEEEAANFANNIRHLVMRSVGMHQNSGKEGDPLEGKVPKPIRKALKAVQAEASAPGHIENTENQTQEPMEEILWDIVKPENLEPIIKNAPHALCEIADNWERFANSIHPTPPFSRYGFLRLDMVLVSLLFVSFIVDYYMVYKGIGAAIGFVLFGDPILTPSMQWLQRNYPNWMLLLEPKNNILRGVPTNNQIALTLLRIGEARNAPLPPVPTSRPEDPDREQPIDVDEIPLDASPAVKAAAVQPDLLTRKGTEEQDNGPKHKHLSKVIRLFKGNTKAVVESKLAVDHVRAAVGSKKAKGHLGILPKEKNLVYAGPSEFKARYSGKAGWLFITDGAQPLLAFTKHDPRNAGTRALEEADLTIPIKEIKRLKRATAFASKPAEMAAAYSFDQDLLGAVEISTADVDQEDHVHRFTAIPERDELFNRLVAISHQKWQNM